MSYKHISTLLLEEAVGNETGSLTAETERGGGGKLMLAQKLNLAQESSLCQAVLR